MKSPLDAARRVLADVTPQTPTDDRERAARKMATECTPEQLAILVTEIMTRERDIAREMADLEARLSIVARASGMRWRIDRHRHQLVNPKT